MSASDADRAREEWQRLSAQVAAAPSPNESAALGELYRLALRDGGRVLTVARFRSLSVAEREDIVADKFLNEHASIVAATNPRAFFVTAITRSATSALRKKQTASKHQEALWWTHDGAARTEGDTVATLELVQRLEQFSQRDQQVLRAVCEGESREDVARCFGTSRANVDQIVSRARRRGVGE